MKSKTTAIILSALLGGLGVDRFYLGYIGIGLIKLFTGGCFGILYIIDIVFIATGRLLPADGSPYEEDVDINKNANYGRTQSSASDPFDELAKAKKLYDEGVINDEEYARMKENILNKM